MSDDAVPKFGQRAALVRGRLKLLSFSVFVCFA